MEKPVSEGPMELPASGQVKRRHKPGRRIWMGIGVAVFLLLTGMALVYLVPERKPRAEPEPAKPGVQATASRCIPPGNNPVILILSDGRAVRPDRHPPGLLRQEDGAKLVLDSCRLSYQLNRQDHPSNTLRYNRLFVPKGRQYEVELSDHTKVWVNSDTKLRYPVAFGSTRREVEVTGEAYFEVTPDDTRPFRVKTDGVLVDVLGTSFGISNYPDEKHIRVCLTSGKVILRSKGKEHCLSRGQSVELDKAGDGFRELTAGVNDDLGWKEGEFRFTGVDLAVALRQLARWYDLNLVFRCPVGAHYFTGRFSRAIPLSEVLRDLSKISPGLHFIQEGKNLVVFR